MLRIHFLQRLTWFKLVDVTCQEALCDRTSLRWAACRSNSQLRRTQTKKSIDFICNVT
jgi:hypothetical protein